MTTRVRHRTTGEELEVLNMTDDDYAFVSPVGRPEEARLVHRELLEPDPWTAIFEQGFPEWMLRVG